MSYRINPGLALTLAGIGALLAAPAAHAEIILGTPGTPAPVVASPAGADPAFYFTFTGAYGSGSGTLNATSVTGQSYYQVTSGSLTFTPTNAGVSAGLTSATENLVTNPTPGTYATTPLNGKYVIQYDDELFPGSTPSLDIYGLLFTDNNANPASAPYDYLNLYADTSNGGVFAEAYSTSKGIASADGGTFNLSPAPEPSQFGMLALMGLGLTGLIVRARRRQSAA